jgi:hypothetical protein
LDIIHGSLGINKLQFFILKNIKFFSTCKILQFLVMKGKPCNWHLPTRLDLDPDPDSGGQKRLTKIEKSEEISCFECWWILPSLGRPSWWARDK